MPNNKIGNRLPKSYRGLIAFAVLVVLASFSLPVWGYFECFNGNWAELASRVTYWGDMVAAGGSIAGALVLIVAVLLQRDELALQREELRLTREEMRQARAVYETQERHMARQTELSERSAVLTHLMQIMEYRANQRINTLPAMRQVPGLSELGDRILRGTRMYMDFLLSQKCITDEDRALFKKIMAEIDPNDSAANFSRPRT